jgi:hypothetical protein
VASSALIFLIGKCGIGTYNRNAVISKNQEAAVNGKSMSLRVVVAVALVVGLSGCGKSDSAKSEKPGTSAAGGDATADAKASAAERQAQETALSEVARHWVKGPDGWTTARSSGTSFAPVRFVRQVHEITVADVQTSDLSDSDRMNGFEWAGSVSFKRTPCREAGDQGIVLDGLADVTVYRQPGRWSQWIDFQPEAIRVQKVKGAWQVQADTWLLRGTLPTPTDYANAGVR